ncbi:MAG: FAD-binding protein, partial [Phycisphaerales bacterium]
MTITREEIQIDGVAFPVHSMNTLIIGSGAAGLNAALQLVRNGQRDVAILTERYGAGASFNAGSDKQTYYRLALAGKGVDSPRLLAEDLYRGGSMHGDIALCEAQHSAQAFFNLVSLGVPFPHDRYGGFVGYRTDHDPRGRGTSAGPLTSRHMCECLGDAVRKEGIEIFDHHTVVALLTAGQAANKRVCGAITVNQSEIGPHRFGFVLFNAVNIILATGGPGGMYRDSVYPQSQVGSTGLALAIGAVAHNLTESQFGLASVGFRWNLSGSYQQAIPRYVSTDGEGRDACEFLNDHFPNMRTLTTAIFRKGYEWPFSCDRIA